MLDQDRAIFHTDLISGSLPQILAEMLMANRKYEYRSAFAERYYSAGRETGREEGRKEASRVVLSELLAARPGTVPEPLAARIAASELDTELLGWIKAVAAAPDRDAVLAVFEQAGAGGAD